MNYQHAIMKPYFDAGLKDLASGWLPHSCNYVLWAVQEDTLFHSGSVRSCLQEHTVYLLLKRPVNFRSTSRVNLLQQWLILMTLGNFGLNLFFKMPWHYIMHFLAMKSGNWQLQMASIKLMVPLFSAFNFNTYQKVIAQHLADVIIMTIFNKVHLLSPFVEESGTRLGLTKPMKC